MQDRHDHTFEAEQITNYLLSVPVKEAEKNRYADAMEKLNIPFSEYEKALWTSMLKSRFRMACIDAALALKDPGNNVRRKLFIMLAILEASPGYTSYFLSRRFSFFYLFKIAAVGMRSVLRAMAGMILVKNIKQKCS